eukprot:gene5069-5568_t
MCRKVTCDKCGKPTWAGCGMHIEQALAGVPPEQRCKCREANNSKPGGFASMFFGSGGGGAK